jgi:hypothetical protein
MGLRRAAVIALDFPLPREGAFVLDNVPSGKYAIEFTGPEHWEVASITADGVPVDRQVSIDGDVQDLVVTVREHLTGARLTVGVESDSTGAFPAAVALLPTTASDPRGDWSNADLWPVDQAHRFSAQLLPTGTYRLAALMLSDARRGWADPALVAACEAQATSVTLQENSQLTITLRPVIVK